MDRRRRRGRRCSLTVPALAWLLVAVVAAGIGIAIGWPALQQYRAREARDTNTERYLAWRGRGSRGPRVREGMTREERRRIVIGVASGAVALASVIMFFVTS